MMSGTGGSFGFVYDTNQWKIQEFETIENAYALCEFIGNFLFIFNIFSKAMYNRLADMMCSLLVGM